MSTFEEERDNVGPGWQGLIQTLHTDLASLIPGYEVLQIKEKFGGLRYYIDFPDGTDEHVRRTVYRLIASAEDLSERLCEECGSPGENKSVRGWWKTLCDSCRGRH